MAALSEDTCGVDEDLSRDLESLNEILRGEPASEGTNDTEDSDVVAEGGNIEKLRLCLQKNYELQALLVDQMERVETALQVNKQKMDALANPRRKKQICQKTMTFWTFRRGRYFRDHMGCTPPIAQDSSETAIHSRIQTMHLEMQWVRPQREKRLMDSLRIRVIENLTRPLLYQLQDEGNETNKGPIQEKISRILMSPEEELFRKSSLEEVDWDRVSDEIFGSELYATDCYLHWTNHISPLVNEGAWSQTEDRKLVKLAKRYKERNWVNIAKELGSNRTAFTCLRRYQSSKPYSSGGKWTTAEDGKLKEAVELYGIPNWVHVASHVGGGRTSTSCYHRWTSSICPDVKKGKWSPEEDELLREGVKAFGLKVWSKVAQFVPGRTQSQCRERYVNVLDSKLKKGPWTPEEDKLLLEACAPYEGNRIPWSKVAKKIPSRTDSSCTIRWRQLKSDEEVFEQYKRQALNRATMALRRTEDKLDGSLFLDAVPESIKRKLESFKHRYISREKKRDKDQKQYPSPSNVISSDNARINDLLTSAQQEALHYMPGQLLTSFNKEQRPTVDISECIQFLNGTETNTASNAPDTESRADSNTEPTIESTVADLLRNIEAGNKERVEDDAQAEKLPLRRSPRKRGSRKGKQAATRTSRRRSKGAQCHTPTPSQPHTPTSQVTSQQPEVIDLTIDNPSPRRSNSSTVVTTTGTSPSEPDWLNVLLAQFDNEPQSSLGPWLESGSSQPSSSLAPIPASFHTPPVSCSVPSRANVVHTTDGSQLTEQSVMTSAQLQALMSLHPHTIPSSQPYTITPSTTLQPHTATGLHSQTISSTQLHASHTLSPFTILQPHAITPSTTMQPHTITPSHSRRPTSSEIINIGSRFFKRNTLGKIVQVVEPAEARRTRTSKTSTSKQIQLLKGDGDFPIGPRFVIQPVAVLPQGVLKLRQKDSSAEVENSAEGDLAMDGIVSEQANGVVDTAESPKESTPEQSNPPSELKSPCEETAHELACLSSEVSVPSPTPPTPFICTEENTQILTVGEDVPGYQALPKDSIMAKTYSVELKRVDGVSLVGCESETALSDINPNWQVGYGSTDTGSSVVDKASLNQGGQASGSELSEMERSLAEELLRLVPRTCYKSKLDIRREMLAEMLEDLAGFDLPVLIAPDREELMAPDTHIIVYEPNIVCHTFDPHRKPVSSQKPRAYNRHKPIASTQNVTLMSDIIVTALSNEDLISQHFVMSQVPIVPSSEEILHLAVVEEYGHYVKVYTTYEILVYDAYCPDPTTAKKHEKAAKKKKARKRIGKTSRNSKKSSETKNDQDTGQTSSMGKGSTENQYSAKESPSNDQTPTSSMENCQDSSKVTNNCNNDPNSTTDTELRNDQSTSTEVETINNSQCLDSTKVRPCSNNQTAYSPEKSQNSSKAANSPSRSAQDSKSPSKNRQKSKSPVTTKDSVSVDMEKPSKGRKRPLKSSISTPPEAKRSKRSSQNKSPAKNNLTTISAPSPSSSQSPSKGPVAKSRVRIAKNSKSPPKRRQKSKSPGTTDTSASPIDSEKHGETKSGQESEQNASETSEAKTPMQKKVSPSAESSKTSEAFKVTNESKQGRGRKRQRSMDASPAPKRKSTGDSPVSKRKNSKPQSPCTDKEMNTHVLSEQQSPRALRVTRSGHEF